MTLPRPRRLRDLGGHAHASCCGSLGCTRGPGGPGAQKAHSQVGRLRSPAAEASSGVPGRAGGRSTHYPDGCPARSAGARAGRAEGQARLRLQPQHSAGDLSCHRAAGLLPWGLRAPSESVPVSAAQAGRPVRLGLGGRRRQPRCKPRDRTANPKITQGARCGGGACDSRGAENGRVGPLPSQSGRKRRRESRSKGVT